MGKTIFIAGVYGTGKSTLCSRLAEQTGLPSFSAGDLISSVNREQYGANKAVADKNANQSVLTIKVRELNAKYKQIILAGHFCIFNAKNEVDVLPNSVFTTLSLARIVLLEADAERIAEHLQHRDKMNYPLANIEALLKKERSQAKSISQQLNCPLTIYQMTFTDLDAATVSSHLEGG